MLEEDRTIIIVGELTIAVIRPLEFFLNSGYSFVEAERRVDKLMLKLRRELEGKEKQILEEGLFGDTRERSVGPNISLSHREWLLFRMCKVISPFNTGEPLDRLGNFVEAIRMSFLASDMSMAQMMNVVRDVFIWECLNRPC